MSHNTLTTPTTLYSVRTGSYLYGTNTPASDVDIKHIVLPSLQSLLLGRRLANKAKTTNTEIGVKNTAADTDEEWIPIQVFARDFAEGQAYAVELAFSIDGTHADQSFDPEFRDVFVAFVRELRTTFLTSNMRAMCGYAVKQASTYSSKGERLNAVRAVIACIRDLVLGLPEGTKLGAALTQRPMEQTMSVVAEQFSEYVSIGTYDTGKIGFKPCLMVLGRIIPFTNTAHHSLTMLEGMEKQYGARAAAATADNVDWKATMHAIRIVDQAVELMSTGSITLPHSPERVAKLLAIRRGEVDVAVIGGMLDTALAEIAALEKASPRPPCDEALIAKLNTWVTDRLIQLYQLR